MFFFCFSIIYDFSANRISNFHLWKTMNAASENLADIFPVMFTGKTVLAENCRLDIVIQNSKSHFLKLKGSFKYLLFVTEERREKISCSFVKFLTVGFFLFPLNLIFFFTKYSLCFHEKEVSFSIILFLFEIKVFPLFLIESLKYFINKLLNWILNIVLRKNTHKIQLSSFSFLLSKFIPISLHCHKLFEKFIHLC